MRSRDKNVRFPIFAILVLAGIGCLSFAGAVASATALNEIGEQIPISVDNGNVKEYYPDVEFVTWDPLLEKETPHYMLLILNNEGKANMLRVIDECYASKEDKAWMADFLRKMWEKYPVIFSKNDGYTIISIEGNEKGLRLTDEEQKGLEKVDSEITRYLNDLSSDDNSPKWSGNEHAMIINDSCWKWGVNAYYRSVATSAAPQPDTWWSFPYNLINHYWNPNPSLSWLGQGRYYCDYNANQGKTNHDLGYYYLAYQHLGYSSHFLTDLGNPLHTGKEAEQLFQGISPPWSPPGYSWVHNNYEGYVNAYWSTAPPSGPYNFSYFVNNNWYYYPMTNPFLSAQSLAQYSNTKLNTLYYYVYNNPYTLQNEPNTYMITANVLIDTSKHTLGLVKYVRG
jgi:hypothetical protein